MIKISENVMTDEEFLLKRNGFYYCWEHFETGFLSSLLYPYQLTICPKPDNLGWRASSYEVFGIDPYIIYLSFGGVKIKSSVVKISSSRPIH